MNNIHQDNCFIHLPWEIMPTNIFNKYREAFSSGEAFLGLKQSEEDAPHGPVSSSLSAVTRSYIGSYAT